MIRDGIPIALVKQIKKEEGDVYFLTPCGRYLLEEIFGLDYRIVLERLFGDEYESLLLDTCPPCGWCNDGDVLIPWEDEVECVYGESCRWPACGYAWRSWITKPKSKSQNS